MTCQSTQALTCYTYGAQLCAGHFHVSYTNKLKLTFAKGVP